MYSSVAACWECGQPQHGSIFQQFPKAMHALLMALLLSSMQNKRNLGRVFTLVMRAGKGRRLNKRMRDQRWTTAPQDIISMNIHVDL